MRLKLRSIFFVFCCFGVLTSTLAQTEKWRQTIAGGGSFSSPNAVADLNADGVEDLVIGGGKEGVYSDFGINAFDGKTGELLWYRSARSQMYGSAQFFNINNDGVLDLIIVGRDAQLLALNGKNGAILWQFWPDSFGSAADSGWYNFYNPQLLNDLNGDGTLDFVISNGGKAAASASDTNRPAGKLMLMSGKEGKILGMMEMPDGRETYFAPLLNPGIDNEILFGSGGETMGGSLWSIQIDDLLNGSQQSLKKILSQPKNGFIAAPSFYKDSVSDKYFIVVPVFEGGLTSLDAQTYKQMWLYSLPNTEAYVSPTLGYFNNDRQVDVFTIFAHGIYPFYSKYTMVALDGKTGTPIKVWDNGGIYQLTSANAIDFDGDGLDELLMVKNFDDGFSEVKYRNQFEIFNFKSDSSTQYLEVRKGFNLYSMPILTDLDHNNKTDLIFVNNTNEKNWYLHDSFVVTRVEFNKSYEPISWPCYMGRYSSGLITSPLWVDEIDYTNQTLTLYPNPSHHRNIHITGANGLILWQLTDLNGRMISTGKEENIEVSNLKSGTYLVRIYTENGWEVKRLVVL